MISRPAFLKVSRCSASAFWISSRWYLLASRGGVDESLALVGRQLVEERLVDHEDVGDEAMVAQRQMLLDLEEAHVGDGRDRVLLAVDDLLLQGAVELAEVDHRRHGAERLELLLDHRRRHRADLGALVVGRLADGEVAGELLEAQLPEHDALDVDLLQRLQDRLAGGPVDHAVRDLAAGEQERQIENLHAGCQRRDPGGRKDGDLEGACLHLLDHLRAAAELARREHLHLELAARALLDQLLPLQRGLMVRAGLGLVMADLDGGLGEGSGRRSRSEGRTTLPWKECDNATRTCCFPRYGATRPCARDVRPRVPLV